jgi:class 3 adenylate cyclase
VLFLDVEGYTKICERLRGGELNEVIERYFSVVMDAIYTNNGDVSMTAGDGLMVLYLGEDRQSNALEAQSAPPSPFETKWIASEANPGASQSPW